MSEITTYSPLIQRQAADGTWLVYNWTTDRWERQELTAELTPDTEPGTDWIKDRPL